MELKFIKFEEVVEKLGISADRLNQLREAGALRAYRDGSSWKFRADEIDRLASEGLPDLPPPSDIGLASAEDLERDMVDASSLSGLDPLKSLDDLDDLKLLDDDDDGADLRLATDDESAVDEPSDPSDSILLNDEILGGSPSQPPSTIIGRNDDLDADLQLVDDDADVDAAKSDVRLASSGASDVLSSGIGGSGILDEMAAETGKPGAFEGIEELELDLEAEASRILEPRDAAAAQAAARKAEPSDLDLADLDAADGGSDFSLAVDQDGDGTDPVPAELMASSAGGSDIDLAAKDDDLALADSGGSDITLDSADSGINLISPSDSGVALDDIPLDIGGSAILSSLALDALDSDSEISLVSGSSGDAPLSGLQTDDDFQLTPLKEGRLDDEDSSSQVIALDADDAFGAGDGAVIAADEFSEDAGGMGEDYGAAGLDVAYGGVVAARAVDTEFTTANIVTLACGAVLLLICSIALLDMVRNIWSWNEPYTLNSALLDAICGLFGLKTK